MRDARHREPGRTTYVAAVCILSVSFWSSGVVLIRALEAYELWRAPYLAPLFLLSVPVVLASMYGTRRTARALRLQDDGILDILSSVLLLHAIALGFMPSLYALATSSELSAAAWLLWFGGTVLAATRFDGLR